MPAPPAIGLARVGMSATQKTGTWARASTAISRRKTAAGTDPTPCLPPVHVLHAELATRLPGLLGGRRLRTRLVGGGKLWVWCGPIDQAAPPGGKNPPVARVAAGAETRAGPGGLRQAAPRLGGVIKTAGTAGHRPRNDLPGDAAGRVLPRGGGAAGGGADGRHLRHVA